jgi:acetyltransferase-like isoleucine patch superfamily enzyme
MSTDCGRVMTHGDWWPADDRGFPSAAADTTFRPMNDFFKTLAKRIFSLRMQPTPLHRVLAWEHQLRNLAFDEVSRILYYQPMFEARCEKVGARVRLELCPDSKAPSISNVRIALGDGVRLSARTTFSGARNAPETPRISIGDDSYIGHRVVLRAGTEIAIGRNVLIATNGLITGDPGHPLDAEARRTRAAPLEDLGRIEIGDDVWLAYNVSVVGNVRIGEGAVVAANSVVTRDVPAFALVAGNPARVIRMLKGPEIVEIAAAGRNVVKGSTEPLFEEPAKREVVVATQVAEIGELPSP